MISPCCLVPRLSLSLYCGSSGFLSGQAFPTTYTKNTVIWSQFLDQAAVSHQGSSHSRASMTGTKTAVVTVQSRDYTDFDDAASEYSTGANPSRRSPSDYGSPSTLVSDNASPKSRRTLKKLWKDSIAIRARRKQSMDDVEDEVTQGLLGDSASRKKSSKSRPWYIYCMFGGLGCLTLSCVF